MVPQIGFMKTKRQKPVKTPLWSTTEKKPANIFTTFLGLGVLTTDNQYYANFSTDTKKVQTQTFSKTIPKWIGNLCLLCDQYSWA